MSRLISTSKELAASKHVEIANLEQYVGAKESIYVQGIIFKNMVEIKCSFPKLLEMDNMRYDEGNFGISEQFDIEVSKFLNQH